MSVVLNDLQAQVLALEVRLYACCARLQAQTDAEALHDLRIALRKLRSLLRPLRRQAPCAQLEQAAAALGQLSGPWRDLEVLAGELRQQGHRLLALRRQAPLLQGYQGLLGSEALQHLFEVLDDWPASCREVAQAGQWCGNGKRIRRYLRAQALRLAEALRDPAHDRHRLRLLIKRLRYGAEAYPQYAELPAQAIAALRGAQSTLGDWHDHLQWLARLPAEPDLAPCAADWQRRLEQAEVQADVALQALLGYFPVAPNDR